MIKKVFSVILCVLFLWQLSLVGFAHLETSEAFVYQMGGDRVVYDLDAEQNPYSRFFITKDSNLTSFTLTINTTYKA